jgi:uncharacterized protein YvpB
MLIQMLTAGHYVIAMAHLDTNSGYLSGVDEAWVVHHWVVVTAIDEKYIYVNNPYYNRRERYTWDEFYDAFGFEIVEIIQPPFDYKYDGTKCGPAPTYSHSNAG